jgi:hypothetical protein
MLSMKYSLRSLMVVVALAAIVLGGRIAYLSRYAAYHEAQTQQIVTAQGPQRGIHVRTYANLGTIDRGQWAIQGSKLFVSDGEYIVYVERPSNHDEWLKAAHHAELAIAYRNASFHSPWKMIDESSPEYFP